MIMVMVMDHLYFTNNICYGFVFQKNDVDMSGFAKQKM